MADLKGERNAKKYKDFGYTEWLIFFRQAQYQEQIGLCILIPPLYYGRVDVKSINVIHYVLLCILYCCLTLINTHGVIST